MPSGGKTMEETKQRLKVYCETSFWSLADVLLGSHAVPDKEITDALHIATASVYAMDVLLTWNCRLNLSLLEVCR